LRVRGERQNIQNQSCSGKVSVSGNSYRRFPIIDGLARLEAVFHKTRLNNDGFFRSGFPKNQKVINKNEVMNGWIVSRDF
jgi:hypothetical protein